MSDKETVTFEEISGAKDFSLPLISDLVDKKIVITGVRFGEGYFGAYAVVMVKIKKKEEEYRTSSMVLIDQLKQVKEHVENGKLVSATLLKKNEYYTLS